MKIGLYFGSFNPVHIGHLIIANHIVQNCKVDQVWMVVSPQNPLKPATLLNEYHRLHLVNLAIENNLKLKASDIEFKLPKPSYTIDTLTYLEEKYPTHQFSVIMGSDSYQNLHKWKNYQQLVARYPLLVYPRPGMEIAQPTHSGVTIINAPLLDISASFVRKNIQEGKSIQYLVPDRVREEIENNSYYK